MQVFLTSIERDQKEIFMNEFVKKIKTSDVESKTDSDITFMWSFSSSEKNLKIWNCMNNDEWLLFYFNGKYSVAGKIYKTKKLKIQTKNMNKKIYQDKFLAVYFSQIFKINLGYKKTNSDMGFDTDIPKMHKISLIQFREKSIQKICKKYNTIESYLGISVPKFKNIDITKIIPSSMKKEPKRIQSTILRRIRDTGKSKLLKKIYGNKCQICSYSFPEYAEPGYSEIHHVWPMADNGDDDFDNMLVLCPNHHTEFDFRIIRFNPKNPDKIEDLKGNHLGTIFFKDKHNLDTKNIKFHNSKIKEDFI